MRVLAMDGFFTRGGAVALLAIGAALPVSAQGSGAGSVSIRRDTVVRIIDPASRAQMDSIRVLMRLIERQPAMSDQSQRLRVELDAMMAALGAGRGTTRIFVGPRTDGPPPFEIHTKGWIGITTGDAPMRQEFNPSGIYVQYLAHPAIVSVDRDSPAQAAGILAGDSLIAYDGVDIVGRTLNLNQMLMPDRKLGITVRRAGENRDYQVTVARAPMVLFFRNGEPDEMSAPERIERVFGQGGGEAGSRVRVGGGRGTMPVIVNGQWIGAAPRGGGFTLSANGVFGARMTTLDAPAAKALNLQPGVLVQDVPEATPAARGGLLPGDIVVAVGGQSVTTLADLQLAASKSDRRSVVFQVFRDRKPRAVTISWGAPATSP